MANVIVLNKLLKNQEYINESNDIAEEVINSKINELTNKLIVPPMKKSEYEKYQDENIKKIEKDENEFINNMNMGTGQSYGMDSDITGIENMTISGIEHLPTNMSPRNIPHMPHMTHTPHMPTHMPRVGGTNNIIRRKSCKKQPHQKNKKIKNHKKSKRIRKI
jgi:hypothetical protein